MNSVFDRRPSRIQRVSFPGRYVNIDGLSVGVFHLLSERKVMPSGEGVSSPGERIGRELLRDIADELLIRHGSLSAVFVEMNRVVVYDVPFDMGRAGLRRHRIGESGALCIYGVPIVCDLGHGDRCACRRHYDLDQNDSALIGEDNYARVLINDDQFVSAVDTCGAFSFQTVDELSSSDWIIIPGLRIILSEIVHAAVMLKAAWERYVAEIVRGAENIVLDGCYPLGDRQINEPAVRECLGAYCGDTWRYVHSLQVFASEEQTLGNRGDARRKGDLLDG